MRAIISIVAGSKSGDVISKSTGEFLIGSDEAADLPIRDEGVAPRHCIINVGSESCRIEDCGSPGGTILNGRRLTRPEPLRHGDRIAIGTAELDFGIGASVRMDPKPVDRRVVPATTALRFDRQDMPSMRQKLLDLVSTKIPVGGAALVFMKRNGKIAETLAFNAEYPSRNVVVNQALVEAVFRSGEGMMSASLMCVPMQGLDSRLGVIYVSAARRSEAFLPVDFDFLNALATLGSTVLEQAETNTGVKANRKELPEIIGDAPNITRLRDEIAQFASSNSTVLIQGETGTGKELIAQHLHRQSRRSRKPLVVINCADIAENLWDSELFGHVKGAFTHAIANRTGSFELASGGTVFLDEVGELPLHIQVKFLRVLQEREIKRVGESKPIPIDVRVIAATHRNLAAMVEAGTFRRDLYHRLKVITIEAPPLRTCVEDILTLAQYFVKRSSIEVTRRVRGISPEAETMLLRYPWPGNVRELENAMDRAVIVAKTDVVLPADMSELAVREAKPPLLNLTQLTRAAQIDAVERAHKLAEGNWSKTAMMLGKPRTYVYALVKRLKLDHLK